MPKQKKQSNEEVLKKAKLARKLRYEKIKSDPALYALEKEKEHQRYLRRKAQKKILSIEEMTPRAKRKQRKKWRENFRKHYHKKMQLSRGLDLMNANTPSCSEGDDLPIREERQNEDCSDDVMSLKSNNSNSDKNPKTNDSLLISNNNEDTNLLQKYKKRLRQLRYSFLKTEKMYKLKIESLQNTICKYKKVNQRLRKKLQSPNTKVTNLLNDKTKKREVKKKILFGEAMKKSLEENYKKLQSNKEKQKFSATIITNRKLLKDCKVLSETKKFTVNIRKDVKKIDPYQNIKANITSFFERDDVSRMAPGKKDCITRGQVKKQKRYLIDTMKNLHKLFEQQFTKISYSYFCKQRPFWVLIPDVNDRDTCLCKIHANIDMLIGALNKNRIIKEKSTKDVIDSLCCQKPECLLRRCDVCKLKNLVYCIDKEGAIVYGKWESRLEKYKKGDIEKEKRIIVKSKQVIPPKEAAIEMEKIIPVFLKHEGTRRWQFSAIHNLKSNIKNNEALIHVDFSENYALKYESEVQAFHFGGSREELSLHTAVIYFLNPSGGLTCKSFCTVSKNLRHDAAAVWAHIVPLLEYIERTRNNNIDFIHFLSDSPSSQYRNKTMFFIISKLHWYYPNLKLVTWNYSEAGHGKGAADGVGGTIKRIADLAVANGKDIVSIDDFVRIVTQSAEKITLKRVDDYQIYEKDLLIPSNKLQALKGTLKVHQVLWQRGKCLLFREESCFNCLDIACNHTNFVGQLNYPDEEANKYNRDIDNVSLPYKVQPKTMLLKKTSTITSKKLNTKISSHDDDKENVKITSDVIIKTSLADNEKITLLSDVTPDNKLHLQTEVNIDDMVSMYNISNVNANFSGMFESFVRTQTPPSQVNPSYINSSDTDSEDNFIFRSKRKLTPKSLQQFVPKPANEAVQRCSDAKPFESLQVIPRRGVDLIKPSTSSLNFRPRKISFSDDDDEFDIPSRSKLFFK